MLFLSKIVDSIKTKGFSKTVQIFISKYIYYTEELVLLERDLSEKLEDVEFEMKVTPRLITMASDWKKLIELWPHKIHIFEERKKKGFDVFGGFVENGEKLIGYGWMTDKSYYEEMYNYTFKLNPKQIYQFDGYIFPEYRGGAVSYTTQKYLWEFYSKKGIEKAISCCAVHNTHALYYHGKMGFKEKGIILRYTKVLFFKNTKEQYYSDHRFAKYKL